ncbi:hypothetical protein HIM67_004704 [Escherichia coli]|nr:hypothetical protein [Escherichia coli]KDY60890.1 hypothetical protein AD02_5118 [Escherichia coli 2-460-02_S4_C2]KEJ68976.1 hypothetical protein AC30_1777 [Escherichia coli 3-020-07_S3_C2]EFH8906013.1 hypothetical protein [Escherichia coli]EFI9335141.1 hypothetical protein [Escherichia coli]
MFSNFFMASSADLYVLLYSESQKCFHIETVSAMIDNQLPDAYPCPAHDHT